MTYSEFAQIMRAHNRKDPQRNLKGRIVIKASSFEQPYTLQERTYGVSNDNKAYLPNMGGYSIYGGSMDEAHSDPCCRLEAYLKEEHGGANGWEVEDCYFTEGDEDIYDAKKMKEILSL